MRIQIPANYSEENVTVTANALFVHFANDFASFINDFMTSRKGAAWLQDLQVEDVAYRNFNPKDPAALLKDLARNGGSKLRPALNSKIERGFLKDYYEGLDELLGERNAWLHRQVAENRASLLDLITSLLRVCKPLGLPLVDDCKELQTSILNPVSPLPIETVPASQESALRDAGLTDSQRSTPFMQLNTKEAESLPDEFVEENTSAREIGLLASEEKHQIGDVVNQQLLSHSYVLHTNGDIRDRASDEILSQVNGASAESLSALLIARKPAGGRIRITEDGILCAFFGDKWGYLAHVKSEDWFPNHLPVRSINEKGEN